MNVQAGRFKVVEFVSYPIEDSVIVEVKETGDAHELNDVASDILDFCKIRYEAGQGFSTGDIVDFLLSVYEASVMPREKIQNDVDTVVNRFVSVGLVKMSDSST